MRFLSRVGVCLALSSILNLEGARAASNTTPVVHTLDGALTGVSSTLADKYLGIPYAAAPVGQLRWKPPQPAPKWQGVRAQDNEGSPCPQAGSGGDTQAGTDEACLNLDIYTPVHGASRTPKAVIVYFYGGAFQDGAARFYDGSNLASDGDVIVVVVNYRLGALGYLSLPGLSTESPDKVSGDYGIQDQQAALGWVRDNIQAFGGDPGNVTIMGQSAGGLSVVDHLLSPLSKGLFAKATVESGTYSPVFPTLAQKTAIGQSVAAALGCTQTDPTAAVACMRAVPVAQLLAAQGGGGTAAALEEWDPTVGGSVLPVQPLTAFATGRFNKVPLLIGTNHDEGRYFAASAFDLAGGPLTAAQYPAALTALFDGLPVSIGQIVQEYPLSAFDSPDLAYAQVFTDAGFSCSANFIADQFVQQNLPVFEYEESDEGETHLLSIADPDLKLQATHTGELPFLWPDQLKIAAQQPAAFTPAEALLSRAMIGAWTAFARSGSPSSLAGFWPPLRRNGGGNVEELTVLGLFPTPAAIFLKAHRCEDWETGYQEIAAAGQAAVAPSSSAP